MIGGQVAFIAYVSPSQVNAQVPSTLGTGTQQVIVKTAVGSSQPYTLTIGNIAPGLLAPSTFKIGAMQYVAAIYPDGVTFALPTGSVPNVASRPAQSGDSLTFYGIGFGPVIPNVSAGQIVQANTALALPLSIAIGGSLATISYQGLAPGIIGLYQFNVVVPNNVPSNSAARVTFAIGGVGGPALYTAIDNDALPQLQDIHFANNPVFGGQVWDGIITLSGPAPRSGASISLSSSNASVSVPANVVVPAGAKTTLFPASTVVTPSVQDALINAQYGSGSRQTTLEIFPGTVTPPLTQLTLVVTLNLPGYASADPIGSLSVLPENGLSTFTVQSGLFGFVHCTAGYVPLTVTPRGAPYINCSMLSATQRSFSYPGISGFYATNAWMELSFNPPTSVSYGFGVGEGSAFGPIIGTLSVTLAATPSAPAQTLTGTITGQYLAAF